MKRTFTVQPIVPKGYTGGDYNNWMKYVQKQINKLNQTKPLPQHDYGT